MESELPDRIKIHYYLSDQSHAMDAFILNRCETNLLSVVREICDLTGINISIETLAHEEGGLQEIWIFIGKSQTQLALIISIFALAIPFLSRDSELKTLQKQNFELQNEKLKIELEELKKKDNCKIPKNFGIADTLQYINDSYKIIKHKSNYFFALSGYSKINRVSADAYNKDRKIGEIFSIPKVDFYKYIRINDELPIFIDENAIIEIISPVLKIGKYKWKGTYQGQTIDFLIKDNAFKKSVINQEIAFKSGMTIECVLEIFRQIDDIGNEKITGYAVSVVTSYTIGINQIKTTQGIEYSKHKKYDKSQCCLEL